jgi:hypothetical protein
MPPAGDTCAPRGSRERLIILGTTSGIGRARPYAPVAEGNNKSLLNAVARVFVAESLGLELLAGPYVLRLICAVMVLPGAHMSVCQIAYVIL